MTDGIKYADESESSKPVICISFGMLIPFSCAALIIPCAIKSLDVIITSGSEVIIFSVNSLLAVFSLSPCRLSSKNITEVVSLYFFNASVYPLYLFKRLL